MLYTYGGNVLRHKVSLNRVADLPVKTNSKVSLYSGGDELGCGEYAVLSVGFLLLLNCPQCVIFDGFNHQTLVGIIILEQILQQIGATRDNVLTLSNKSCFWDMMLEHDGHNRAMHFIYFIL